MFTNLNSPFQQLQHPILQNFWVKRDDLIDPYISGNKWRKLKYILQDCALKGKSHLVTFGGAYSNHLVATASAAARAGLRATAFVRGEEVVNEMLVLCRLYGMRLIYTDRESYRDKKGLFMKHFADDPESYFIDEGGASAEAVRGSAEIITELPGDIDHLFCSAGTGTTAAGLMQGILDLNLKTRLHVIPVLKGGEFIREEISKYLPDTQQLELHTGYHFGGYARTQPALLDFIKKFVPKYGMLIDPVYTAKMFYAIDDLAKQQYFGSGEKISAIHTGGLLGIMGMKQALV